MVVAGSSSVYRRDGWPLEPFAWARSHCCPSLDVLFFAADAAFFGGDLFLPDVYFCFFTSFSHLDYDGVNVSSLDYDVVLRLALGLGLGLSLG